MILLYSCSLWLLILGFFLVSTLSNLYHLTNRLLLATIFACLCFYELPFTFSYELPTHYHQFDSLGMNWQWAYQMLYSLDKPYNQFPSLHVTYALLLLISLWQPNNFFRQRRCIYQIVLLILCLGIAISTLFTWQHHFLDVIGGLLLAIFVFILEGYLSRTLPLTSVRLVIRYLVIAIGGFLILSILPTLIAQDLRLVPIKLIMTVISSYWLISFLLLSLLYLKSNFNYNQNVFSKNNNGKLRAISWLTQLPIIACYHVIWYILAKAHWLGTSNRYIPITISLNNCSLSFLATSRPDSRKRQYFDRIINNYDQVIWVDVSSEISTQLPTSTQLHSNFHYHYLALLDIQPLDSMPTSELKGFLDYIKTVISEPNLPTNASILIVCQCTMGWLRSVAIIACCLAYLTPLRIEQIRQLLDFHFANHHISYEYLSDELLGNLKQKSSF